jgi:hypothetical protein
MENLERNARWEQLTAARAELDDEAVVIPALVSRIDGKPRQPSPRTRLLAEALAVSASWARISEARKGTSLRKAA